MAMVATSVTLSAAQQGSFIDPGCMEPGVVVDAAAPGEDLQPGAQGQCSTGIEEFNAKADPTARENAQQAGAPVAQAECFEVIIDPVTGETDLVCLD